MSNGILVEGQCNPHFSATFPPSEEGGGQCACNLLATCPAWLRDVCNVSDLCRPVAYPPDPPRAVICEALVSNPSVCQPLLYGWGQEPQKRIRVVKGILSETSALRRCLVESASIINRHPLSSISTNSIIIHHRASSSIIIIPIIVIRGVPDKFFFFQLPGSPQ